MEVQVSLKTKEEEKNMENSSTEIPNVAVFYGENNLTDCMRDILKLHIETD